MIFGAVVPVTIGAPVTAGALVTAGSPVTAAAPVTAGARAARSAALDIVGPGPVFALHATPCALHGPGKQ